MTDKLTIYSKMNIYYCDGMTKPTIIATSIKDLFNNAKDYLPSDKEEFKDLKENTYYDIRNNNWVDVIYRLSTECYIFTNKNSITKYLTKVCGFNKQQAEKHFTNYVIDTENNKRVFDNIINFD